MKIKEILQSGNSKKRADNSNISKFITIVEFDDREGLIKELGKMLRTSWSKQKENEGHCNAVETEGGQPQLEEVKAQTSMHSVHSGGSLAYDELFNSLIQDSYKVSDPDDWI
jgi:hypothetical protein